MLQLPNGCSCSEPAIFPANWQERGADINQTWYIQYYFHDPLYAEQYPRGKFCQVKAGINRYKTLSERRDIIKLYLKNLLHKLVELGYNPHTRTDTVDEEVKQYEIDPDTPFIEALKKAHQRLKCEKNTKDNIGYMLAYMEKSARQLRYIDLPIKYIRKKHVRLTIENCGRVKDYWSANQFNHYRGHMGMLFAELVELEAIDSNYCLSIKKEKTIRKLKRTLTIEERKKISTHLHDNYYAFWRYMQIFFHSGARTTELFRIKGKDVKLKLQEYKVTIKKGRETVEVMKPIKDIAMIYWAEIMANCKNEDYLFSEGLKPGAIPINPKQISKRWRVHVKSPKTGLGIDVDFYGLKHLNTSEVVDNVSEAIIQAQKEAAKLNSHTTPQMVMTVYDTKNKIRKDEHIKSVRNEFA